MDHIEIAAKYEYETTMGGSWDDVRWEDRIIYYSSARRIIGEYITSLSTEIVHSVLNNQMRRK